MKKARNAAEVILLQQIPNVGPRMESDFIQMGIKTPKMLKGKNPFKLYQYICEITKTRHDPCVLDTYMAAVDFMNGGEAVPWWEFTAIRKKKYSKI